MRDQVLWAAVAGELAAGRPCALLAVSASRGSSPGRVGMLMAVGLAGPLAGSIGGGHGESTMVDLALARLRAGDFAPWRQRQIHRPGADDASGMICGGGQEVVVACWQPGQPLPVPGAAWEIAGAGWHYRHQPAARCRVFLIGGGHVSLALSRLLLPLDFAVEVIEERRGISTFDGNDFALLRHALPYEALATRVPAGPEVLVGIMTHAAQRDAVALQVLSGRDYGYLGLLGSRHKLRQLQAEMILPPGLRAPMGLPIGSHTAEEIAVSIAAEMVAVRHAAVDRQKD